MLRDVYTVAWKEWQEYLRQERPGRGGTWRGVGFIVLGGAFIGWQLDPDFGRSALTVLLTAFLSIMFVTTVVPDTFAGERERHTLETLLASRLPDRAVLLGKVAASVSYGVAISLAVLPPAVVAANLIHGAAGLPWFEPALVVAALLAGLLGGLLIAGIGVQISLYAQTARQAHQRLGFVILGLFMTPAVAIPSIPPQWRVRLLERATEVGMARVALIAFGFLLVLDLVLLAAAMLRFRRARLIA